jgi:SNF2 family DNA or RNA helicase
MSSIEDGHLKMLQEMGFSYKASLKACTKHVGLDDAIAYLLSTAPQPPERTNENDQLPSNCIQTYFEPVDKHKAVCAKNPVHIKEEGGHKTEARGEAEEQKKLTKENKRIYNQAVKLAQAYEKENRDFASALAAYEEAWELRPQDPLLQKKIAKLQVKVARLKQESLAEEQSYNDEQHDENHDEQYEQEGGGHDKHHRQKESEEEQQQTPRDHGRPNKRQESMTLIEGEFVRCAESGNWHLPGGYSLSPTLYDRLYSYQREGVMWMWDLHQRKVGGVLGDDMGLGKTFQVSAFLSGLRQNRMAHSILLIAPVSVVPVWVSHLKEWLPPNTCIKELVGGTTKRQRVAQLASVCRAGGVAVSTYGMVSANEALFRQCLDNSGE